ncbi:MAG TPA: cobalt-precorrin-4 C(11)-methyltransferase, partial [Deltaproteobacteria bacterium]|nr:cobalt-precorrin-4 C(11)-methyltransferase [Deltaproteobacteria bacterium]
VFLILPGQESPSFSRLYDSGFSHGFRKGEG